MPLQSVRKVGSTQKRKRKPTLIHRVSGASVLGEEAWAVVEGRSSGLLRGEIVELAGGRSVLAPLLKSKSVN
jgi:hypothetical protein